MDFWMRNRDFIVFTVAVLALIYMAYHIAPIVEPIILHNGPSGIELPGNEPGGP